MATSSTPSSKRKKKILISTEVLILSAIILIGFLFAIQALFSSGVNAGAYVAAAYNPTEVDKLCGQTDNSEYDFTLPVGQTNEQGKPGGIGLTVKGEVPGDKIVVAECTAKGRAHGSEVCTMQGRCTPVSYQTETGAPTTAVGSTPPNLQESPQTETTPSIPPKAGTLQPNLSEPQQTDQLETNGSPQENGTQKELNSLRDENQSELNRLQDAVENPRVLETNGNLQESNGLTPGETPGPDGSNSNLDENSKPIEPNAGSLEGTQKAESNLASEKEQTVWETFKEAAGNTWNAVTDAASKAWDSLFAPAYAPSISEQGQSPALEEPGQSPADITGTDKTIIESERPLQPGTLGPGDGPMPSESDSEGKGPQQTESLQDALNSQTSNTPPAGQGSQTGQSLQDALNSRDNTAPTGIDAPAKNFPEANSGAPSPVDGSPAGPTPLEPAIPTPEQAGPDQPQGFVDKLKENLIEQSNNANPFVSGFASSMYTLGKWVYLWK